MEEYTQEWAEYQRGIDYKRKINLMAEVDRNERFDRGKQWAGVKSNGLPTPVFNILKRVRQFKVASILSSPVKMVYSAEGISDEAQDPRQISVKQFAQLLCKYSETTWERLKQDYLNSKGLKKAYISGDLISYFYWDDTVSTGQEAQGDISEELVDNVNYIPGNPNNVDVQTQPYIILAFRKMVNEVRAEAKKYKRPTIDIEKISGDSETQDQFGDLAKIELEDSGKTIVLLKLWKENGHVLARKSVKQCIIRDKWDTGLTRYPVAMMNWEEREGSCHGLSEASEIIPNQIAINQLFAQAILSTKMTAFPKVLYDRSRINSWDNAVGAAIGVEGDITNAADYMQPGQISYDVYKLIDAVIKYTKEMLGANETALGDDSITKTASGIIALQKQTQVPLKDIQNRFYQYIEDIGLIWLDFWMRMYGARDITIKDNDIAKVVLFSPEEYQDVQFKLKIDVGPSTQWSEVTAIDTLNSLLQQERITFIQYLQRLPNGIVPKTQELIEEIQQQDIDKQVLYELMARYFASLPPNVQGQLQSLSPEQMEAQIKQMIMGGGNIENSAMAQGNNETPAQVTVPAA